MAPHLYLSVLPEALIASMLGPEEFGLYYAVHHEREARRAAIFYEIDPTFRDEFFNIDEGFRRCTPHGDGRPKRSVYISVYRVLEHIPMSAVQRMYLIGPEGESLELQSCPDCPETPEAMHLYQEIAPTSSLVVSRLSPQAFFNLMVMDQTQLISLPALCFMEQELGELARDPAHGSAKNLPYVDLSYMRECLLSLKQKSYPVKIVYPTPRATFEYRTIKGGVYIGNRTGRLFFRLPAEDEYRAQRFKWWDLWTRPA
jgi:hypothetical protein